MFRISRYLVSLQSITKRFCCSVSKVKVTSTDDDEFVKIYLRYGINHKNLLNLRFPKEQQISEALSHIKLIVNLHLKKEQIRRTVSGMFSSSSSLDCEDAPKEELEVSLVPKSGIYDGDIANIDAWSRSSHLKIGDFVYEVNHNTPSVPQFNLPDFIIANCFIRPHFVLECAFLEDSQFIWYRSAEQCLNTEGTNEKSDIKTWQKVGEEYFYQTSIDDVGHKLKVVCIPRLGDVSGPEVSAVSLNVVDAGPAYFPFQERHLHTKNFTDVNCLRCVSYNVLASCYVETKKFPYCSRKGRDRYYRKQLLKKELLGYNADILCLQESQDRIFDHDLQPLLAQFGYDGFYVRKGGRRFEGVTLFYRTEKFRLIDHHGVHLNEIVKDREIFTDLLKIVSGNYKDMSKLLSQDTALQIAVLEHRDNPMYRVIVANTHLYSNKDKPEVRLIQAALCTHYMEYFLKMQKDDSRKALLFCGDFNSLPDSAAHEFVINGSYQCSSSWQNSSTEEIDATLRHNLSLDSACGTPEYTNYTEEFSGCLDYIFYTKDSLCVQEVVPMVRHEEVTRQVALPSEYFPSDHLALVCTLKWKHWQG